MFSRHKEKHNADVTIDTINFWSVYIQTETINRSAFIQVPRLPLINN